MTRDYYKHKICIICEGFEEYEYLSRLKELELLGSLCDVDLVNAESNGNVYNKYVYNFQLDVYEAVLIFCDTDRKPYEDYGMIKKKIQDYHDNLEISEHVIIFVNVCTMQVILSHFDDVVLRTQNKKKNAEKIKELTGVENYDAHLEQRKKIFDQITVGNFCCMMQRVSKLSINDVETPSSNFYSIFIQIIEEPECLIQNINELLEVN